jgi:hypothetical protein
VTFVVGVFDLLTYTIPGSLYLAFLGYLAARLHLIDIAAVDRTPVLLLVIAVVVLSYLLGYIAYPLGHAANRIALKRNRRRPLEEFLGRNPAARGRDYVQADPYLLLSAVELHDKDVAAEVARLRAGGLMLRNAAPPLMLACVAAIVELFFGSRPALAAGCAALFAVGFFSLIVQGRRLGHWAILKTLEVVLLAFRHRREVSQGW